MSLLENTRKSGGDPRLFRTSAERPLQMLRQCPVYAPTPLLDQPALARHFGLSSLYIKDESNRMGLGSFKALGGAFAVAQMISDEAGTGDLQSDAARSVAARMTFITASAGNHGLSVAAGARVFGARAVIVLATSVPEGFAGRIRGLNAEVVRVDGSYEASVDAAIAMADENGWLLLADGSWPGYTERPALVMEGYSVLAEEVRQAFAEQGNWPSHVIIQAGVGGLAAAVAGHIRDFWPQQPEITVVEPDAAPCLMESVRTHKLVRADGPLSNMGRLDCKDASLIAYLSLREDADRFVTITDDEATFASSLLHNHGIATTPSGAASVAALARLDVGADSRCLVFVTEGLEDG